MPSSEISTQMAFGRTPLSDGTEIFYRHMGDASLPPFLLLHGYPASSFQYRNLIPILAQHYHVIAPDLPGFGFSKTSPTYKFTFDSLSKSIEEFIAKLGLKAPMPVYIFDYGAPTVLRIFLRKPDLFNTIITQNGNAYEVGLGDAWEQSGMRKYWSDPSQQNRDALKVLMNVDNTKGQYTMGHPQPDQIPPETYMLDHYISNTNAEAMLDLFGNYKTNVELYPQFQAMLKEKKPKVLAIWGKHDPFFTPPGAEAFVNDVGKDNFKLIMLDAGHFALESHNDVIGKEVLEFLKQT